jgi:hypothetical protein
MMNLNQLPNQRPDEHVVLFLRRHWIALAPVFTGLIFLGGFPLFVASYFSDLTTTWLQDPLLGPVFTVLASIYFLALWLFVSVQITDYFLDTWIVTTERIINIEQKGLFHRIASELDLAAVQDTTAEIHGVLPTVLTYGDVYVQTAGEKERFTFKSIDNPEHVKELIAKLVEEDKQRIREDGEQKGKIKSTGK